VKRIHAHRESSHASLALVIPVAGFGGLMLALGIATGSARRIIEALPLSEPGPNGWPVFVLGCLVFGCWWQMRRAKTHPHEPAEATGRDNEKWPDAEPLAGAPWPLADAGSPWFGTAPFTDPVPVRRTHPATPHEDLIPDPDQAHAGLLADPAGTVW
jgi:hypothetical protein